MLRRPFLLLVTAGATVLAVAACGSNGSTKTTTTATPASAATAAAPAVQVSTAHTSLGTVLVAGPKKLTVYMFEADHGSTSACSGACAQVWPPVTTGAAPLAAGGALAGKLSTITRSDGTKQVAYAGHPLYYFVKDKASGETTGQGIDGFGARWYVLGPDGSVMRSTGAAPAAKSKPAASAPPATQESEPNGAGAVRESTHEERHPAEEKPVEPKHGEEAPPQQHSEPSAPAGESGGIPQGGGGDHDGDNSGGPSDGDGNI